MDTPFSFEFEGENCLREMVANGRGGLLLSAHIGNWEIAGHLLKRLNTTINVVMYDGEQEQIKAYLEKVTGGRNMNLILIKEDLSHIYAISAALDNNQLVCMHADRFVAGNKSVTANFLGAIAQFPAGPFILASRFSVPVSYVFAFKESRKHYHLYASRPEPTEGVEKKVKMKLLLDNFVTEMEAMTRKYPDQWFNFYDFWKK
jgi:predicted LPLAT superfamily acyltransferase